jgi:hypothetical protein
MELISQHFVEGDIGISDAVEWDRMRHKWDEMVLRYLAKLPTVLPPSRQEWL